MTRSSSRHRLAEERSLVYHRAVAARLESEPALLERARERILRWIKEGGRSTSYSQKWLELLQGPLPVLIEAMLDEGEPGRALRQATPFAGSLDPRERWRLWREAKHSFGDST